MKSIGEAAESLGVSSHTLRYYEKEGIVEPHRTKAGVRNYSEDQLNWLSFVLKLRDTQMSISDIKTYTQLVLEGEHTSNQRLNLLEKHQKNIEEQIEAMQITNEMVKRKISTYKERMNNKKKG
ncbi:MerR family transcriptional regulator [Rossellomorea aquimaris]|uniref:MerR family transcriptional regulator n=1 Tax=Rossellomorea aquimaris TaxID=189382 RepID=UPI001CD23C19|nr:MerR family transcriptional regulator [Rossellomorea aquimaris]MCA1053971.1 MerR family transcriptional regulator [Rossellomorea aquimaris]